MKQAARLTLALLVPTLMVTGCSLLGAGAPSKPLHFYTIGPLPQQPDESGEQAQSETSGTNASLTVSAFDGSGIYADSPIVWKNQQHLQRFQYNRWANPPAQMLQEVVVQLLRRASSTDNIRVYGGSPDVEGTPFQVRGHLRRLYLKRKEGSWKVVCTVDLQLIKRNPDQTLPGRSLSSEDVIGSWPLTATGQAEAPESEQKTPSAMNALLSDLNQTLSKKGGELARTIIERVRVASERSQRNTGGSGDGKPNSDD